MKKRKKKKRKKKNRERKRACYPTDVSIRMAMIMSGFQGVDVVGKESGWLQCTTRGYKMKHGPGFRVPKEKKTEQIFNPHLKHSV